MAISAPRTPHLRASSAQTAQSHSDYADATAFLARARSARLLTIFALTPAPSPGAAGKLMTICGLSTHRRNDCTHRRLPVALRGGETRVQATDGQNIATIQLSLAMRMPLRHLRPVVGGQSAYRARYIPSTVKRQRDITFVISGVQSRALAPVFSCRALQASARLSPPYSINAAIS